MSLSTDRSATCISIQLLLFVPSRPATRELAEQIRQHLDRMSGQHPADLEVVELGERPYLAEHYKLVVTPALVKVSPLPAQVLAGADLTTQLQVWWPRWQGQAALSAGQPDPPPLLPDSPQTTATLLQMSEEIFQLQQDRARLEEHIRFKDRVLAMLVHDLRGPLTATALAIETLQQQRLDPELSQQLFEQARQQLRKLDVMVADILESGRNAAAALVLHGSEIQLAELCHSVLADLTARIQAKELTVKAEIPNLLPTVHGDLDKIRQVLVNLLDNAIKYTPRQGRIRLQALHRTTQMVQVTVSDTGPGIPEDMAEGIFTESVRLERDEQQEGYGIGLSLCRRIIRAHFGRIWVDSAPGGGSNFHFTLPTYRV